MIPDYMWSKTTETNEPGKTVLSHMNDVRAVAALLLKTHERLLRTSGCDVDHLAVFAGLHDIGKISPAFQVKCPAWLEKFGLNNNSYMDQAVSFDSHGRRFAPRRVMLQEAKN